MRFESEKYILAFRDKTWKERRALRRQAIERDRSIIWIQCVGLLLVMPGLLAFVYWLMRYVDPHSLLRFIEVYLVLAYPAWLAFSALFITPRIRRAVESDTNSSA